MNEQIVSQRIKAIRRRLNKKGVDCLVITKPANVTYVTNFSGDDSWALITPRMVYLVTDSRYTEQAEGECRFCRIIRRTKPIAEATAGLLDKLKSGRTIAIEKSTSLADFGQLSKHTNGRLKSVVNTVEAVRTGKDSSEIAAIEEAGQIAAKALKQTMRYMKPGITESELAGRLDFQIRKLGARSSFETIVAFGPNASRPHHQPSTRKLKKTDTVLIDFGAKYKNYCCDLTRCFCVGRPTALYRKVYEAVEQAQAAAIRMLKAGAEMVQVDAAAREMIGRFDLPVYGHGTGHGLGLEIHEQPFLARESKGKLRLGMVLTIEPGVYIPGKLGVRIEDDILVTETGCRILTRNCSHASWLHKI